MNTNFLQIKGWLQLKAVWLDPTKLLVTIWILSNQIRLFEHNLAFLTQCAYLLMLKQGAIASSHKRISQNTNVQYASKYH